MQAGVYGHVCVWSLREWGWGWRGTNALLPLPADLPPGIDQKQINFHFQLGIQLNPKWWGGNCNVYIQLGWRRGGWRKWQMTWNTRLCIWVFNSFKCEGVAWAAATAATAFHFPRSGPLLPLGRVFREREEGQPIRVETVRGPSVGPCHSCSAAPFPGFCSASKRWMFSRSACIRKQEFDFAVCLARPLPASEAVWQTDPISVWPSSRDIEWLCESNLAAECLVSQDPSSFAWLFLCIQRLPFVGVTEWGPAGRTGFLPAAWGTLGPVFITRGGNWGRLWPSLEGKSIICQLWDLGNPDRGLLLSKARLWGLRG